MFLKTLCKYIVLYLIGGLIYITLEILYKGDSHWSMVVVGGLAFLLCGLINKGLDCTLPLWQQGIIGGALITLLELIAGIIINIILKLDVWDYTNYKLNFLGQICVPFSILWCLLAIVAIVVNNYIRYFLFGESKPHYRLGGLN
ncbi:putative ABC transporter permease [Clostridium sp. Marseille-P299]|uniref:putative ABC transporter permease n=1 Tax=Clostridium sp. Marseille-P299 TaxID=1805477 RepID=UPI0008306F2A|nr:hypothetical protein [Clostridium sp. Marseille-P299]